MCFGRPCIARRMSGMHVNVPKWRELFRSNDLAPARSVLVSIASMEFEVRLRSLDASRRTTAPVENASSAPANEFDADDRGPFIVEVQDRDWAELADVIDQIVDEQEAFDEELDRHHHERKLIMAALVLGVVAAGGLLWAVERHTN